MAIYSLNDLLSQRFTSVGSFGFDKISEAVQAHLDWLNGQVNDQLSLLAESTEDSRRVLGGNAAFEMKEVDEYGQARTQAPTSGIEIGFPLRKFEVATGWTNEYIRRASVSDVAQRLVGMQNAYLERLSQELKFAVFSNQNYSFVDKLGDGTTLAVKAFLNADGSEVPDAPDGTTFLTSHNHYKGYASGAFATADVDALITNVEEHGHSKGVTLFIPAGMVATLVALSGTKFVKMQSSLLVAASDSVSTVARINPEEDTANTTVGVWDGRIMVATRSWMPAGYIACVATGSANKPLVRREDKFIKGLAALPEYGNPVITAKSMNAYCGFGAFDRSAVAILDTANASYNEPSGLIR